MRFLYTYDRKYDIRYLSLFYKVCSWLGIVPLFDFNDLSKDNRDVRYGLFLGTLIIALFTMAVYMRVMYVYNNYTHVKATLDFAKYVAAMLCSITIIFKNLTNSKNFCEMLRKLVLIEKSMNPSLGRLTINWMFCLETCTPYILFICHTIVTFISMAKYNPGFNKSSLIYRDVQQMHVLTTCIQLHNLSVIFLYRYRTFNQLLLSKVSSYYSMKRKIFVLDLNDKFNIDYFMAVSTADNIRDFLKRYCELTLCFKSLNNHIGLPILILSINITLGLLRPLMAVIANQRPNLPTIFVILNLYLALKASVLAILIVPGYHMMAHEARRTANICFTLLQKYRALADDDHDRALREDIFTLGLFSASKYPKLIANGYYVVDYTMVLMIFGSLTTYFIVLIQLN